MIFWIAAALLTAFCVAFVWQALFSHLTPTRQTKIVAVLIAVILPALALGLYWRMGSVGMPDMGRTANPQSANVTPMQKKWLAERPLIAELRKNPKKEDLWIELISVYVETNRMDQARQAYSDAVLSVPNAVKLNDTEFRKMLGVEGIKTCVPPQKC